MKVQYVLLDEKTRYMVIDNEGRPIVPVVKYMKYLDNIGKAENTLKSYCHHLKLYFEFLQETGHDYRKADINSLSEFIGWLRNPHGYSKITPITETTARRSERTVNTILTCVIGFYDYLARSEEYASDLRSSLTRQISSRHRAFKPFLHHISKGKMISKNIIKLKEPRRRIRTLTQDQIQSIHHACNNIRDDLLIRILYEGGLRIGEALSLWIEDFDVGTASIRVRKSKTTNGEGRKVFVSAETINLFQDYLIELHDADTNYIFINMSGPNRGGLKSIGWTHRTENI